MTTHLTRQPTYRECQRNDWKDGKPRPHREVCGKTPLEPFERVVPKEREVDPKFPEVIPPFKRSPALSYQIKLMKAALWADYYVSSGFQVHVFGLNFLKISLDNAIRRPGQLRNSLPW